MLPRLYQRSLGPGIDLDHTRRISRADAGCMACPLIAGQAMADASEPEQEFSRGVMRQAVGFFTRTRCAADGFLEGNATGGARR
jgi:hypothetical protein